MLLKLPKAYPQFTTIQLPPSTCQTPVLKENVRIAGWSYTEGEKHTELSDAQEPTCRIYIIFSNLTPQVVESQRNYSVQNQETSKSLSVSPQKMLKPKFKCDSAQQLQGRWTPAM